MRANVGTTSAKSRAQLWPDRSTSTTYILWARLDRFCADVNQSLGEFDGRWPRQSPDLPQNAPSRGCVGQRWPDSTTRVRFRRIQHTILGHPGRRKEMHSETLIDRVSRSTMFPVSFSSAEIPPQVHRTHHSFGPLPAKWRVGLIGLVIGRLLGACRVDPGAAPTGSVRRRCLLPPERRARKARIRPKVRPAGPTLGGGGVSGASPQLALGLCAPLPRPPTEEARHRRFPREAKEQGLHAIPALLGEAEGFQAARISMFRCERCAPARAHGPHEVWSVGCSWETRLWASMGLGGIPRGGGPRSYTRGPSRSESPATLFFSNPEIANMSASSDQAFPFHSPPSGGSCEVLHTWTDTSNYDMQEEWSERLLSQKKMKTASGISRALGGAWG